MEDEQLAQDICQDIFVKFWNKREDLEDNINFKAYLFTATRNRAFEHLRRVKMKNSHQGGILQKEQLLRDIEEDIDKYVRLEQIQKAIKTLPEKCQQVFTLSKLNGLSYAEIAKHLGISVKTVENQIVRALKLLREKLN